MIKSLIYFLSPSMLANEIVNIPYIFTLWDLEASR